MITVRVASSTREEQAMASESSFDIVNKVDHQEVNNAVDQTTREIRQRFDFKNVDAGIQWIGESIEIQANAEQRALAVLDVLKDKLVKRNVSLKNIEAGEPKASGKLCKIVVTISQGISQDNARTVSKLIREKGPKSVKVQVQGDELRVTSKSRDDLQAAQRLVKDENYDFAVQFVNYR
jgi:cyclic-di-GMP-binding protein